MIHLPKGLRHALAQSETNDPQGYLQLTQGPEIDIEKIVAVSRDSFAVPLLPLAAAIHPEDAEGMVFPEPGAFGVPTYHLNPLVERGKAWLTRDPLYAKLFDHATLLRLMGSMTQDFADVMNGKRGEHGERGRDGGGAGGGGATDHGGLAVAPGTPGEGPETDPRD